MLDVSRRFATTSDVGELLSMIIDTMRDALRARRASVFQYDSETNELFATTAHGLSADLRLPADRGLIGEAATSRRIINIPDAYEDPRFNSDVDRATGFRTTSLLTIPLVDYEDKLVGVAQVLNRVDESAGAFTPEEEEIATHLAAQAAVALKRASLQQAERLKNKLQGDLEIARRIQQASLPGDVPSIRGYDIAGTTRPAEATGGDAFDLVRVEAHPGSEPDPLLVFMGDATGHGIGPALSVTQATSMLRMGCRLSDSLPTLVEIINAQLVRDLPAGRFITAFFGVLDPGTHRITYLSAGQAPIIVVRASRPRTPWVLGSSTLPLGIDAGLDLSLPDPIVLEEGDLFVLLSDGYYEAMNPDNVMFGADRVVDAISSNLDADVHTILSELDRAVLRHCAERPADDDQTAVLIKRTGGRGQE